MPPENIKASDRTPADQAKSIASFNKVNIDVSTTKSGLYIFTISGPQEGVANAKRKVIERIVRPVRASFPPTLVPRRTSIRMRMYTNA